jgi:hypothetical protein
MDTDFFTYIRDIFGMTPQGFHQIPVTDQVMIRNQYLLEQSNPPDNTEEQSKTKYYDLSKRYLFPLCDYLSKRISWELLCLPRSMTNFFHEK